MALIVVGSANMDLVVRSPRLPAVGETLIGRSFATFPGGKGANQAGAAAKLGGDVRFVGRVGDDAFGEMLRESLAGAGVDVSSLRVQPGVASGIAAIAVDDEGRNTIVVSPGANAEVSADDALPLIGPGDVLLAQLEIPVAEVCRLLAESTCRLKILNPAPAAELPAEVYRFVDVITPNETEASTLTGVPVTDEAGVLAAARVLLGRGVRQVVVTLGAEGCLAEGEFACARLPAMPVKAVDTVAAGDAFSGALAAFLSQGAAFCEAMRLATVAAGLSTTRAGAQASMPSRDEVLRES
ncbi:MAG TPA: ribokinase [Fimbriimonadaceae bacterium]|nr:ribokinase [Fimbriimonadaceae bacterium]